MKYETVVKIGIIFNKSRNWKYLTTDYNFIIKFTSL